MTRILIATLVAGLALAAAGAAAHAPHAGPVTAAGDLAAARVATAKYATSLARAKADGYRLQITQMMPDMGYHFLNPNVTGAFDVTKPPILVYVRRAGSWQLVAFEW